MVIVDVFNKNSLKSAVFKVAWGLNISLKKAWVLAKIYKLNRSKTELLSILRESFKIVKDAVEISVGERKILKLKDEFLLPSIVLNRAIEAATNVESSSSIEKESERSYDYETPPCCELCGYTLTEVDGDEDICENEDCDLNC